MYVHMREMRRGSEDGFSTRLFLRGEYYDMADGLARRFIANGWAEAVQIPHHSHQQPKE